MSTYLYKCERCWCPEASVSSDLVADKVQCSHCDGFLIRDYKAERVSPARVPGGGRPHRG